MENNDIPLPSPPRDRARTRTIGENNVPAAFSFNAHHLNFDKLSGPPSSDPPLFSSDDFQSSALENYSLAQDHGQGHHPLRKRRYRGTWWGEQLHAHAKRKRRTHFKDKRYVDSGVWLGSEDSTDFAPTSDDAGFLAESGQVVRRQRQKHVGDRDTVALRGQTPLAVNQRVVPVSASAFASLHDEGCARPVRADKPVGIETEPHARARAVIIRCLEDGNDNVDLSYFTLQTIPPGLLRPLVQLTKEPLVSEAPSTDDVYIPLEPFLQLFLTRNLLTTLPGEVFELERLRVLSLRHNKLTEVPSAIRNLGMLQDLNVAGNRLTYLPWEVLHLMQTGDLRQLTIHPNPFVELDDNDIAQWRVQGQATSDESEIDIDNTNNNNNNNNNNNEPSTHRLKAPTYQDEAPPSAWQPIHVATSKPQYLDMEGHPVPATQEPRSGSQPHNPSSIPSLRELSLRACTRSTQLTRFLDPADPDDVQSYYPDPVFRLLTAAKRVKDAGGNQCFVCGRAFVIPRTRWVEWWDCMPFENGSKGARKSGQDLYPLPFLRTGCGWACGPSYS